MINGKGFSSALIDGVGFMVKVTREHLLSAQLQWPDTDLAAIRQERCPLQERTDTDSYVQTDTDSYVRTDTDNYVHTDTDPYACKDTDPYVRTDTKPYVRTESDTNPYGQSENDH